MSLRKGHRLATTTRMRLAFADWLPDSVLYAHAASAVAVPRLERLDCQHVLFGLNFGLSNSLVLFSLLEINALY
jgi:hypothetical protein